MYSLFYLVHTQMYWHAQRFDKVGETWLLKLSVHDRSMRAFRDTEAVLFLDQDVYLGVERSGWY